MDRIDLHVDVPAVPYKDLKATDAGGYDSRSMGERIRKARDIQLERFTDSPILTNAELSGRLLSEHCALGREEHEFLERAVNALGLSARAYTRVLRIARTIADLSGEPRIARAHLAEAINYRTLDRQSF
jgi:magnesium chelatase family protein